jgi:hypothetical protein
MSPDARQRPSNGKQGPQNEVETATPEPTSSREMRDSAEQNLARIEELAGLYRPLQEAGDAELAKTASGRKVLEDARALGSELSELYKRINSGQDPDGESHRLARQRQEEIRDKLRPQYLEAYAPHLHLQPSTEALAQILHPEMARRTIWMSEVSFLQAILLQSKPVPTDRRTVTQGLGGDMAPPLDLPYCLQPQYAHREEQFYNAAIVGDAQADANVDGHLHFNAWAASALGAAQSTGAEAWVGGSFTGLYGTSYKVTVDFDFWTIQSAFALFGVSVSSVNVAILIDIGDGTPPWKTPVWVSPLIVPFVSGDSAFHDGTMSFSYNLGRSGSKNPGTVKVFVGAGGHCDVWAAEGDSSFIGSVFVRRICLEGN